MSVQVAGPASATVRPARGAPAGLPRDAWLLLGSMVLATVPLGYLQVVLPLYLNRAGLDPGLIGLLYTASGLVTASLVAVSGVLADRFGRRQFIVWGTALPIASYAVFAVTTDPFWLLVASAIGGVGLANGAAGALTIASFDALLAEHTPPRQRTRVFTWAQALWSLALAAGAAGAVLPELLRAAWPDLGDLGAYRPPFLGMIALAAVATLLAVPVGDAQGTPAARAAARSRGWLPRQSRGPIARYALGIGLLGFGLGVMVQLMPLWFKLRFGADEALLGPWFAAGQALSLSSVLLSPWLERRLGAGRAVLAVHAANGTCLALVTLTPAYEMAAGLYVARSVLANVAWPIQQAVLMRAVVPEERASGAGVAFAAWGLLNAVGPGVGGALLGAGSLVAPPLLGAAAYVLGGLAFGLGFGARRLARDTHHAAERGPPAPTH